MKSEIDVCVGHYEHLFGLKTKIQLKKKRTIGEEL